MTTCFRIANQAFSGETVGVGAGLCVAQHGVVFSAMAVGKLLGAGLVLGMLATTEPVLACGGFFCSAASPVNQAAEQIVFSHNGDGTITAIIQIQYQGPSESFAWVLPVPGLPDVGVSSNSAFATLGALTQPNYVLEYTYDGECRQPDYTQDGSGGASSVAPAPAPEPEQEPVLVLEEGNVGPYDYVVIQPNADLPDPADVALEWLGENGYDVASIAPDVLGPYLESGLNLIAFRLTKSDAVGVIRPVLITYEGDAPVIPIRPTAVAANPNMGVLVWLLGEHRAVPDNYTSVLLNDARINWFNWQSGYAELVSEAADEAGGQGFVTEYAGPADLVENMLWTAQAETAWTTLEATQFPDGFALIDAAADSFRFFDGFRDAVGEATTLPEGVTLDDFGRNPTAYQDDPDLVIDSTRFREALFEFVIEPVQVTQTVLDGRPYMTRLFTTMSPEEMIEDPAFTFNPDLGPIDRTHEADITVHCSPEFTMNEAPWTITLADGQQIQGTVRAVPQELLETPAASAILDDSSSGPSTVLIDNTAVIDDMIDEMMPTTPAPDEQEPGSPEVPVNIPDDLGNEPEATAPESDPATDSDSAPAGMTPPDPPPAMEVEPDDASEDQAPFDDGQVVTMAGDESASNDDGSCSLSPAPLRLGAGSALFGLALLGLGWRRRRR